MVQRNFSLAAIGCAAMLGLATQQAQAVVTTWVGSTNPLAPGDFTDDANWDPNAPVAGDIANIGQVGGGAAFLDSNGGTINDLRVGVGNAASIEFRPGAFLEVTGQVFHIGNSATGIGTMTGGTIRITDNTDLDGQLPGANVGTNGMYVGNAAADSVFNMSDGLLQITAALHLGNTAGSSGTFNQSGGTVEVGVVRLTNFSGAHGHYNMTGGVLQVAHSLRLGDRPGTDGNFFISDGTLDVLNPTEGEAGGIVWGPRSGGTSGGTFTVKGSSAVINAADFRMNNAAVLKYILTGDEATKINVDPTGNGFTRVDGALEVELNGGMLLTKNASYRILETSNLTNSFDTTPGALWTTTVDTTNDHVTIALDDNDKVGELTASVGLIDFLAFAPESVGWAKINADSNVDVLTILVDLFTNDTSNTVILDFVAGLNDAGFNVSTSDPLLSSLNNGTGINYDLALIFGDVDSMEHLAWDLAALGGQFQLGVQALAVTGEQGRQPQPQPQPQPTPGGEIPEPATALLGLAGLGTLMMRRRNR